MSPSLSRKENTFLEVAKYLPCVPRGTQGKQTPQGPGRGRSGRREEGRLEEKILEESVSLAAYPSYALRTQVVPTAVGTPEKENYGVSRRPPSPILVGLFPSISHLVG